jgi:hypothetical protein
MSFTAVESLQLLKKAENERQKRLNKEIDADVQKLRAIADELMVTGEMDSKGYYGIVIQRTNIKYKDARIVIDRFCSHMEGLGFFVPEVSQRSGWCGKSNWFTIRFRPNDETLAKMNEDNDSNENECSEQEEQMSDGKK